MREVINLQIGHCGNLIGSAFWDSITEEHSIDAEGNYYGNSDKELSKIDSYFSVNDGKYYPRTIMIDLEPQTLDEMRCSSLSKIYKADKFISGHSGTENNWAKGYYTLGPEIKDLVMDTIRKSAEECERLEGFQVCHSLGGGTGSGLGSLMLNSIREAFPEKILETFSVFPSTKISDIAAETYNATLAVHQLVENTDSCIVLDNAALYRICQENLDLKAPRYSDLNHVICSAMTGITSSIRFPCNLNSNWRKTCMNLVPFPRLHFFTISHMPLYKQNERPENSEWSILDFLQKMMNPNNILISEIKDYCYPRNYSAAAIFRGNFSEKELSDALEEFWNQKSSWFAEWVPDNLRCDTCQVPPKRSAASASSILSGDCAKPVFQRLGEQFTTLFRSRAYCHLYTEEGMDLMEFTEAESNMNDLVSEYTPCCGCCEEDYDEECEEDEGGE